jgi:predicted DNA-binding ribbon-helix-helix protein
LPVFRKTGVSLEDAFWSLLEEIAQAEGTTLSKIVTEIDKGCRVGAYLSPPSSLLIPDVG